MANSSQELKNLAFPSPNIYELFWNGFGLSEKLPPDYVEENFVLIETFQESIDGIDE